MTVLRLGTRKFCADASARPKSLRACLVLAVALAGCQAPTAASDGGISRAPPGAPSWLDLPGGRLGNLPAQGAVKLGYFQTSDACAPCHTAVDGNPALRDAAGRDISPVALYRSSMMSLAARDPYYLAAFSHELAVRPGATDAIEATCSRCHAPAADVDLRMTGKHVTWAALTSDPAPEAQLARDGVGCVLCHQLTPGSNPLSVSGTTIFGLYTDPLTQPMQFYVSYTPAYGAHMGKSELCATCHTVITRALDGAGNPTGPQFYEQAAFLEWQSSSFVGKKTCQDCHVPTADEDGVTIRTPVARPPGTTVSPRQPVGRHVFAGANAYVLRLLADNVGWAGTSTPAAELSNQATQAEDNLAGAADLSIDSAVRDGGDLVVAVQVTNRAGHKLPTGYPSRRVFLHLTVTSATGVVFESGAVDAQGRLIDGRGNLVDVPGEVHPHRDLITQDDEVQIYEAVPGDASGHPVTRLLDATTYLKDNRLLPDGWVPNALIAPVGTSDDANFGSHDRVTYRFPAPAGPLTVKVALDYQTLRPTDLDGLAAEATDASRRFFDMVAPRPPLPIQLRTAESAVP
jgi:hypothetical protein